MADLDHKHHDPTRLTPTGVLGRLPSRPVLTNPADGWDGVVLQRFRHPPSEITAGGLRDNLIIDHLSGPVMVENDPGQGVFERRWINSGEITLTPAEHPIHRTLLGRPDVVLVHLPTSLLQEVAQDLPGGDPDKASIVRRFGVGDPMADHLVRLMLAEAEAPGPFTSLMASTLAHALAMQLLRLHSPGSPRLLDARIALPSARMRRVIELMRSALDEDLTLGRLAECAGFSSSYFARAFKNATGQSPHRYLIGLRIDHAQALLETTDLTIIEIGLSCGFETPSHFATAFRKVTGHAPREWRKLRRS